MMADHDLVLKCLKPFEADYPGHGGEVLTRLFKEHPDLAGKAAVAAHGATVLRKLSELLRAKGNHAAIIKQLDTSQKYTHKFVLKNFKLITEALVKVMDENEFLNTTQKYALNRVTECIIGYIKDYYKE